MSASMLKEFHITTLLILVKIRQLEIHIEV
jgi:hypothetical protein